MQLKTFETIIELEERIKEATGQFHNNSHAASTYDPVFGQLFGDIFFTVTDLLFIGLLAELHMLITGDTGNGKTDLVKLVCQGIFGSENWFLLRLNPNVTEETFCDIDMKTLSQNTLRDAVSPATFLSMPCTILDEANRAPAALLNILLGYLDKRIELKCGLKFDVGYRVKKTMQQTCKRDENKCSYENILRREDFYHVAIGTINDGKKFSGTFEMDPALQRRFTLQIPFDELRCTPYDVVDVVESRIGHAELPDYPGVADKLKAVHDEVICTKLDPFAEVFLVYLANVGRCPHSRIGFHLHQPSQELCTNMQCRIQKIANGFCQSVSGLSLGVLIFLKRAACGVTALRAARTIKAIGHLCQTEDSEEIEQLREFVGTDLSGPKLYNKVVDKYIKSVVVTAEDIRAILPFVGLGGRIWMADEYVAKNFNGSHFLALQEYVRLTYSNLENFFRQNNTVFQQLHGGNGAIEKLRQRLEHAERFNDPAIRYTIEPFLDRCQNKDRGPDEVADEIKSAQVSRLSAFDLVK